MPKLVITADVHGSFGTWMTLRNLLGPKDDLAVAGDLFDTRYGPAHDPDFQPDQILQDLSFIAQPVHYVYGNCDHQHFYPDHENVRIFTYSGRTILMHHGHQRLPEIPDTIDLVVQGHTHLAALETRGTTVFVNPGSLAKPRNSLYTYATFDGSAVSVVDIKTRKTLASVTLDPPV